jgi:SET domain-containing protein
VKALNFLLDSVFVGKTVKRGRGIFTREAIPAGTVVEIAPVIVMTPEDRKHIDKTIMHDYIFEWGDDQKSCIQALGYVPLYNHAYESNCEYEMDYRKNIITIRTVRNVRKNEELTINYNGEWNSKKPIWFDVK